MRWIPGAALSTAILMGTGLASAHLRVLSPSPRPEHTANDIKSGPCGQATLEYGVRHLFAPGETITLEWNEYVAHPGHFRISFDAEGDDDFVNPVDQSDMTPYPSVLVDGIPSTGGGDYAYELTLPDVNCSSCTLQVIQVMTEAGKTPTAASPTRHLYFQCVDLELRVAGGTGGAGTTTGGTATGGTATGGTATGGTATGGTATGDTAMEPRRSGAEDDGGCSTSPRPSPSGWPALLAGGALGAALVGRRRATTPLRRLAL